MFAKPIVKKKDSSKIFQVPIKINDEEIQSELDSMSNITEYHFHTEKITESSDSNLLLQKKSKMVLKESTRFTEKITGETEKSSGKEKIEMEPSIPYLSSDATINELKNVIKQQANTAEDRFKILDARDKLMRLKQAKIHTLATAKVTIGTCPDMCPEKERLMREYQRQAASYELLNTDEYKINHSLAVKQYSRSSADQEEPMPQDLRPVSSLKMTMSYLLHEITDLADEEGTNLTEWYHFIWDRLRGIRKDITQQELCCLDTVELVEQCARFHIVCSERLCAEDAAVFDKKINTENLTKCLQTLKYMYHDLREKGFVCINEAEFRAYIILLNLNNANFMWDLQRLPSSIQKSREVNFAIKVYSSIQSKNYAKFFKLVKETTYLNACILLRYFFQVRVEALNVMVKAYCRTTSTSYPLYEFIDILGFDDENEAIYFCEQAGLNVSKDEMYVILNRQNICSPPPMMDQARAKNLVEAKRISLGYSLGQMIAGDKMPNKLYLNHKPHNSFDAQGFLKSEAINANDQNRGTDEIEQDPYEYMDEDMPGETINRETSKLPTYSTSHSTEEESKKPKDSNHHNIFSRLESNISKKKLDGLDPLKSKDNNKKSTVRDLRLKMKSSNKSSKRSSVSSTTSTASSIPKKRKALSKFEDVSKQDSNITDATPFTSSFPQKSILSENQMNTLPQTSLPFSFTSPSTPSINFQAPKIPTSNYNQFNLKTTESPKAVKKEKLKEKVKEENKTFQDKKKEQDVLVEKTKKQEILKRIDEKAMKEAELIEANVVRDICASIVKEEIEKNKFFERLSDKIFNELLDQCIQDDVKSILDKELYIQSKIKDIYKRVKNRIVLKYAKIWRLRVSKIKQQRKALGNTPVWLPKQSLEACAKAFYHKEQNLVIQNMRKRNSSTDFDEIHRKFLTPIETKIYEGLKDNFKALDNEFPSVMFWKLIISWPCLKNRPLLHRYKHIMNEYLCPGNSSLDPIIKVYKPRPYETLNICIKHVEDVVDDENYIGSDGLFFIATADEDTVAVGKRLTKTVLARQKLMPTPLLFIIVGDDQASENVTPTTELKKLLNSGYLSEYVIHHEKKIDESIILRLTQTGIFWLTLNKSPPIPLEMNTLVDVIDTCLTEELWLRISGHASFNPNIKAALEDPKFVIDLHNETVNYFIDIILDPENTMYTDFPEEFRNFLPKKVYLPCTYQYFDSDWKKEDNREKVESVINSLSLPPWPFNWPINDTMELHKSIQHYCQLTLKNSHPSTVSYNILGSLFFMTDKEEISHFILIIIEIIKEKLRHIDKDITVVYNKNHVKLFRTLPWWLKSSILMNYIKTNPSPASPLYRRDSRKDILMKQQQLDEEKVEVSRIIEKYDNIYENEDESDFNDSNTIIEQSSVDDFRNASMKLEKMLSQQQISSQALEKKLESALKET
ncbi:uncharacterized protein xmas [Chelonus insularis]|uniref:uncharacterized protein xmas n=1 Tax=Chelonus insularis TaxID=460826 RepID=UPI00158D2577|nr:uncharacterized protein LOC118064169 [Chelonus insularis]